MIHIFVCTECSESSCNVMLESGPFGDAPRVPTDCPYSAGICKFQKMGVQ